MDFGRLQEQASHSLASIKERVDQAMSGLADQKNSMQSMAITDPDRYLNRFGDVLVRLEVGQRLMAVDLLKLENVLPIAIGYLDD